MKEAPEIDDSRGFQNFLLILVRGRLVLDLPIDGTDDKHPAQRPFYSHSIVDTLAFVNSTRALNCAYIYSRQCEIVSKLELTWNSVLSSTVARESAGMVTGCRGVNP